MTDDAPQLRGEVRKLSSLGTEIGDAMFISFASLWTVAVLVSIVASNPGVGMALSGLGMSAVVWLVALEVGCDTPFGREITFAPESGLGPLFGPHPVVEELRGLSPTRRPRTPARVRHLVSRSEAPASACDPSPRGLTRPGTRLASGRWGRRARARQLRQAGV